MYDIIFLEFFIVICPIVLYFIYLFFERTIDKNKNDLMFDIALITSFYLLVRFDSLSNYPVILFDSLVIISYIKKRKITSLLLSILLILYFKEYYIINYIYLIIKYTIIFVLSVFIINRKQLFSNMVISLNVIFYIFFFSKKILISIIMFYIVMNLIIFLFIKLEDVMKLFNEITNIEKEKRIVESLFKITHEIKNPIAVCKGYLDMFDINNIEHSKKYIPIMKSEINRTLILLEDYLSISNIKINKEIMDLNCLIEDTVLSLKPIINNKGIVLSYNIIDELYLSADYNRLKQTLINIIKNSIESIDKKGFIKINTEISKKSVKVIIEDNGKGMKSSELSKIKEAFFTTKERGTGLGIYLSNEIVKAHNGSLEYISAENKGTKVIIELPLN